MSLTLRLMQQAEQLFSPHTADLLAHWTHWDSLTGRERIRLCLLHLDSVTCSSSSSVFCFLVPFFCLLDVFVVCLNKHQIYRHPQLTTCNRCTFSSSLTITQRTAFLGKSFFKKETFYLWRPFKHLRPQWEQMV